MSTVLTNGIIIPDNGSRNWGGDLANNWNIIDLNIGYMTDVKNRVTTLENSVAENTANIQINTSNISALQTSKQDALSDQQIANIADVTNKANDADVVHKSGDETISGVKTFSDGDKTFDAGAPLIIQGCDKGNEFSKNARTVLELRSNRDTANKSCIYITKFRQNKAQGSMGDNDNVILTIDVLENEVRTNELLRFTARNWVNDAPTEMSLVPTTKESNIQSFLGTSSRPWGNTATNAINGVNPGALSLPGTSAITIDTSDASKWALDGTTIVYTPPVNGWLTINVKCSSANNYINVSQNGLYNSCSYNSSGYMRVILPVYTGKDVIINAVGDAWEYVRLFPCQGNV